ncbi:hypothetical protein C3495_06075 [Clostridiaceae bacterium 14S0207]|nr:hypothetical protein C3495_06075 [Clostridiaceae bacterium 14S0207]
MKKRVLGSLVAFTLSMNLFSISTFAATKDINALYKEAYDATNTCLKVRTQQSVKNARQAISKLPKNITWAIGEFSKQVDSVQQPIFIKLLNSLSKAKNTKKQADINATRKMINDVIETQYKRTWSSELDKVQQGKINTLVTLVNSNKKDDNTVNAIKNEFNDIKTVKYNDVVANWIKNYSKDVEKALKVKESWDMPSRNPNNLKGIDVSNWQSNIDFKKVKAHGVQVVYMKATEGCTYKDKYMEQNYRQAKENELNVGFYHFFRGKGIEEARYFYNTIKNKSYNCKLALDVESANGMSKNELTNQCLIFMQELNRLSGNDGVVYTYTNFALNNLDSRLSKYSLWIAHYGVQAPGRNNIWRDWAGFQYSSKGTVPGINGNCDLDEFTPDIFVN